MHEEGGEGLEVGEGVDVESARLTLVLQGRESGMPRKAEDDKANGIAYPVGLQDGVSEELSRRCGSDGGSGAEEAIRPGQVPIQSALEADERGGGYYTGGGELR